MKTLLFVRTENKSAFDGSVKGTQLKINGDVTPTPVENQFQVNQGFIETGPVPEISKSGSFTLEATVTPAALTGARQNIMESQTPPVALFIDEKGLLNGSINVQSGGWKAVKSAAPLTPGKAQKV